MNPNLAMFSLVPMRAYCLLPVRLQKRGRLTDLNGLMSVFEKFLGTMIGSPSGSRPLNSGSLFEVKYSSTSLIVNRGVSGRLNSVFTYDRSYVPRA